METTMNQVELEKAIEEANLSYAAGIPFMTDAEYDILWKQLYSIDPNNPLLYHTAQNHQQIHNKTWHKHPIYGTNKAFNMEDLKPFLMRFGSYDLVIEPKYDGCAAVITQTQEGLKVTLEGDGLCGGDITHLIPYINFSFTLRHFQAVELLIPFEDWDPEFGKNPRNVVAGWLARKYEKPPISMTAVAHNFGSLTKNYKYDGDLESLSELLLKLHAEWGAIYPIDGLMLKVKDEKQRLIAGNNGTTNSWSIAWKPPIQTKETTVTDIEWNVSRLGRVIPTVIYESIELCGTTNSRVTGNNAKWLKDNGIAIGSKIVVGKAGEIIPKIILVKDYSKVSLPIHCPKCFELLVTDGVHLVCDGENCIAQKIVSIAYFYSHKGIKIDGIGEAMIEKILANNKCYEILVKKPWALLDMRSYDIADAVYSVIDEKLFVNIYNQINLASGTKSMAHFIAGLGLPGLAYKSALRLCQYIKTGKITGNMSSKAQMNFISGAGDYKDASEEMKVFKFAPLPNVAKAIYCITGSLSQSREDMIHFLAEQDYEYSAGITKETNYLVVGDDPGKTKIQKATKYNIPQITETQLHKLLKKE
jgi:DNA ligase (NAD+)